MVPPDSALWVVSDCFLLSSHPPRGYVVLGLVALVSGRFGETDRQVEFQEQWEAAAESWHIVPELPRETMAAPSLQISKVRLNGARSNLV